MVETTIICDGCERVGTRGRKLITELRNEIQTQGWRTTYYKQKRVDYCPVCFKKCGLAGGAKVRGTWPTVVPKVKPWAADEGLEAAIKAKTEVG